MIFIRKELPIILISFFLLFTNINNDAFGGHVQGVNFSHKKGEPIFFDHNFTSQVVAKGLSFPTSMAFLDDNDILVLEKNNGTVKRIVNGNILPTPVLDVNVANANERGMLGIGILESEELKYPYVFLYYTEDEQEGKDKCPKPSYCEPGSEPLGNRLYRYEFNGTSLINPKLLLDLPSLPGPAHNGGVLAVDKDKNIFLTIGDVGQRGQAQNFANKPPANGTGGILRITPDGEAVEGILGQNHPLNKYYAYGIRNSFGMDFDPLTGNLWDSENGPAFGDEINLVEPGFNSGWRQVQGIWNLDGQFAGNITLNPNNLVNYNGKERYSIPEFIWNLTHGVTSVKFIDSDIYGEHYKNDLLVGNIIQGQIFKFDLNNNRTEFILREPLDDRIANDESEEKELLFAQIPGGVTDIEVGPDGYIYAVSFGQGTIYKIIPTSGK